MAFGGVRTTNAAVATIYFEEKGDGHTKVLADKTYLKHELAVENVSDFEDLPDLFESWASQNSYQNLLVGHTSVAD